MMMVMITMVEYHLTDRQTDCTMTDEGQYFSLYFLPYSFQYWDFAYLRYEMVRYDGIPTTGR